MTLIFNRDMLINESTIIDNCIKSVGTLSNETIVGQHPWVNDIQKELERLKKQKEEEQKELESQYNPFVQQTSNNKDKKESKKHDIEM